MSIAYDDGTFGPVEDAKKIAQQLAEHFAGVKPLPKEPAGALFGRTPEEVKAKQQAQTDAMALSERVAVLEKAARIRKRGIVAEPTDADVARFGGIPGPQPGGR